MAKDFKVVGDEQLRTVICTKESATVLEAGDIVDEDGAGNIAKADASSASIAYCPKGAPAGVTDVEVTVGNDFVLEGTGDAAFAAAIKGTEVDLVMSSTTQLIDVGTSSTDVFRVDISENAGAVGATTGIRVRINKPLF
jgi:hypothetical protein